ncbi:MAG: glycosyltransferase family 1 protein, partial [Planctomycetota bacterium]
IVKLGDNADFARQTLHLLEDTAEAERLGNAGRKRIADSFSVADMVRHHAELYLELAAKNCQN